LPSPNNEEIELSSALKKLKKARDKRLAHHKSVDTEISTATYSEILHWLEVGKEFLAIMGSAYLSTAYQFDDGSYPLTSDAERAARCLKRMLEKLVVE